MIVGGRKLRNFFRRLGRRGQIEATNELESQANELLGRSVALVPELSRTLLLSGKVVKRVRPRRSIFAVAFGTDRAQGYAIRRHEDFYNPGPITSTKAPTQDGLPGRKYLERPYRNMIRQIQRRVGRTVERTARRLR